MTIVVTGHGRATAGLDDAAVSVNFDEQQARNVLSVPVSALLATAGNRYAVQEAAAPYRLITVTPGLFAAGYVQTPGRWSAWVCKSRPPRDERHRRGGP